LSFTDLQNSDGYPYFESTLENSIENAKALFFKSYDATVAVSTGKDVWVTETGWPVEGPDSNLAKASIENAKTYWDQVGCALFGKTNVYWYTLYDSNAPLPHFGISSSEMNTTPLFDLSCSNVNSSTSTNGSSSTNGTSSAAASQVNSVTGGLSPSQAAGIGANSGASNATTLVATYSPTPAGGAAAGAPAATSSTQGSTQGATSSDNAPFKGAASVNVVSIATGAVAAALAFVAAL
jgi:glucan endo-1,3-beta-D-glucosidase